VDGDFPGYADAAVPAVLGAFAGAYVDAEGSAESAGGYGAVDLWFRVWGGEVVEVDVDVEFLGEFEEGSGGGVGAWSGYPDGPVVGYFDLVAGGGGGGGAVPFLLDRPSEFAEGVEDSVWVVDVPGYRRGSPLGVQRVRSSICLALLTSSFEGVLALGSTSLMM